MPFLRVPIMPILRPSAILYMSSNFSSDETESSYCLETDGSMCLSTSCFVNDSGILRVVKVEKVRYVWAVVKVLMVSLEQEMNLVVENIDGRHEGIVIILSC